MTKIRQGSAAKMGSGLTVEWWPTEKPVPYGRNPRLAPEAAIAKVAGSLTEFGWRQPIVVDGDGVIVVGHTRLLAAQRLGLETVPVHVATDLSPEQVKAYRLMDNRSAQETSWDTDLLPLELADLAEFEFDLALTGFEPILVGWPQGHMPKLKPPADSRAIWEIASTEGNEAGSAGSHPTIKPVETIRRPISYHTKPGGLIYEPFSGSGTALIAAEEMGRVCYAMEQAPQFIDVAVARWEAFTGKKAAHG